MNRRSLLKAVSALGVGTGLSLPFFRRGAKAAAKAPDPRAGLIQYKNLVYGSPRTPDGVPHGRPSWRPANANVVSYLNVRLDLSSLKKKH